MNVRYVVEVFGGDGEEVGIEMGSDVGEGKGGMQ